MLNALCIDVDDLSLGFAEAGLGIKEIKWEVERETHALLEHLAILNLKASFFIPGCVISRAPQLVLGIAKEGHEVASHGWSHNYVERIGKTKFIAEVTRSKQSLEDLTGMAVDIFKAPIWSITPNTLWAFDVLAEVGFSIDHSVMPKTKKALGKTSTTNTPWRHSSGLLLIPPTTLNVAGIGLPIPGGFYLGHVPNVIVSKLYARVETTGIPFNFYFHPFEHSPHGSNRSWLKDCGLRCSLITSHLGSYKGKLDYLSQRFGFGTVSRAYYDWIDRKR